MLSYRRTTLWVKIVSLMNQVYDLLELLPAAEKFALDPQMRRAVTSIVFNYAEGYGRFHDREFGNFLSITRGSLFEVDSQICVCEERKFFPKDKCDAIHSIIDRIAYELTLFINKKKRDDKGKKQKRCDEEDAE